MEKFFYLLQVFDGLNILAWVIFALSTFLLVFCIGTIITDYDDEDTALVKKGLKPCTIIVSVALLLAIFVPTRKTIILMAGGKVIDQTIQNNPKIKEIPSNTIDLVNEYLKKEIQGLQSEE